MDAHLLITIANHFFNPHDRSTLASLACTCRVLAAYLKGVSDYPDVISNPAWPECEKIDFRKLLEPFLWPPKLSFIEKTDFQALYPSFSPFRLTICIDRVPRASNALPVDKLKYSKQLLPRPPRLPKLPREKARRPSKWR